MPNAIIVADAAGAVGAVAKAYARRTVFADYHTRMAANTLRAQAADLAVFAAFLDVAGLTTTREPLWARCTVMRVRGGT